MLRHCHMLHVMSQKKFNSKPRHWAVSEPNAPSLHSSLPSWLCPTSQSFCCWERGDIILSIVTLHWNWGVVVGTQERNVGQSWEWSEMQGWGHLFHCLLTAQVLGETCSDFSVLAHREADTGEGIWPAHCRLKHFFFPQSFLQSPCPGSGWSLDLVTGQNSLGKRHCVLENN